MKKIPRIQTKLEVKNELNDDRAKLYLYGTIRKAYAWEEEDACISSSLVRKKLAEIKDKGIDVHINSGGGDVFESIAICNLLKAHEGDVAIYIDGMAGSGASIIAMAGNEIHMPENAMMMVHKAWTIVMGNADDLRKQASDLDKVDEAVKASYRGHFVGTEGELEQLLADESFLNAKECLELGFCTQVINEESPAPKATIKETLLAKYKKADADPQETLKPTLFNAFRKQEAN